MIGLSMIGLMGIIGSISALASGCVMLTRFTISYCMGLISICTSYGGAFVYQCLDIIF